MGWVDADAIVLKPAPLGALSYVWEDPGKSITIRIHLDVVDRLRAEFRHALESDSQGRLEVGGILLGKVETGERPAVVIEAIQPVVSEHRRGASYSLSTKDRELLQKTISRRKDQSVVGY